MSPQHRGAGRLRVGIAQTKTGATVNTRVTQARYLLTRAETSTRTCSRKRSCGVPLLSGVCRFGVGSAAGGNASVCFDSGAVCGLARGRPEDPPHLPVPV